MGAQNLIQSNVQIECAWISQGSVKLRRNSAKHKKGLGDSNRDLKGVNDEPIARELTECSKGRGESLTVFFSLAWNLTSDENHKIHFRKYKRFMNSSEGRSLVASKLRDMNICVVAARYLKTTPFPVNLPETSSLFLLPTSHPGAQHAQNFTLYPTSESSVIPSISPSLSPSFNPSIQPTKTYFPSEQPTGCVESKSHSYQRYPKATASQKKTYVMDEFRQRYYGPNTISELNSVQINSYERYLEILARRCTNEDVAAKCALTSQSITICDRRDPSRTSNIEINYYLAFKPNNENRGVPLSGNEERELKKLFSSYINCINETSNMIEIMSIMRSIGVPGNWGHLPSKTTYTPTPIRPEVYKEDYVVPDMDFPW